MEWTTAVSPGFRCALAIRATLVLLATSILPAAAQQPETVKVGKETKRTAGSVTQLENGDIACYMHMKDAKGTEFTELADFDICFQKPSLIGKRVSLKYTIGNVMAASCQGNPDCKKSDTVALVSEARIIDGKAAAASPAAKAATKAAGQTSFCTPMETIVFACRTGTKMVSVCATPKTATNAGYLQYRFGKPDSRDPLELMLPAGELPAHKVATGEAVPFAGGGGAWLRFRNGDIRYVVYTGIGKWGPKGETREKQGLVVERGGKNIAHLKCSNAPISELGPEWFEKTGIQSKDEDFLFPD